MPLCALCRPYVPMCKKNRPYVHPYVHYVHLCAPMCIGDGSANDKIPKDSQGLFLNHEGTIFRGYLLHSDSILSEGIIEPPDK